MDKYDENMIKDMMHPTCVELHKFPLITSASIDEKIYNRATIEEREWMDDSINKQLIREMKMFLYENKHPDKHIIKYPANWIESLKERFAPSWILDKYPVKFIEHTATLREYYPLFDKALPEEYAVVRFYVNKNVVDYPTW